MILLWGLPDDIPTAAVCAAVERRGHPFFFLDQNDVLETDLDMSVDRSIRGMVRTKSGQLSLEAITGAYLRPYESSRVAALAQARSQDLTRATAVDDAMLCWSELSPARVINRPSTMASNGSKPYQLALIRDEGFEVPNSLITTDAASLEAFWQKYGQVIYKSASGVRSVVSRLTPQHRERFCNLAYCPTQFQQWIPGIDVRVHVVGEEVFACQIGSCADDYRYPRNPDEAPQIGPHCLPDDVAGRCLSLAKSLGLALAGIDLRRTPEGEWYCFEVNPSPGFSYYELATGQPIADAIASLLVAS
jgi:glutathione synthase/RimK-type ligase-like ATP-grasp enzyme